MTEWEPATDAEVAMRDALRTDDQESYFRILAGVDLLLPVSADALAGLAPLGWGTWSTGGRTHVLAFTSPSALQACLADYTGSARRVAYTELADTWPNLEWWLAVNPGLPIEGYLPAWFVAQLSRGDLRLPTRGTARDTGTTAQSPQDLQAANAATAGGAGAGPADPRTAYGQPGSTAGFAPRPAAASGESGSPAGGSSTQVGPGGLPIRTPGRVLPSGLPSRVPTSPRPSSAQPTSAAPASAAPASGGAPGWPAAPASAAPASATPASGAPASAAPASGGAPGWPAAPASGGAPGWSAPGTADPGSSASGGGSAIPASGVPAAYRPPDIPRGSGAVPSQPPGWGAFGSAQTPAGQGTPAGQASQRDPHGPLPTRTPMAQTPPLPGHLTPSGADAQATAPGAAATPTSPSGPGGPLPRRQVTPASERPPSMAAAAQAMAGSRPPQPAPPQQGARPGIAPPVVPGVGGAGRPPTGPSLVPPASVRPSVPPAEPPGRVDAPPVEADFVPANDVERDLYDAADAHSTDRFLSTLLLATVLLPVADDSRPGSVPGEPGFEFRTEEIDGERFLVVFTSRDRLTEHNASPIRTVGVRFYELIRNWPDPAWSFAVNPGSPVGAKYPGPQVIALASWATDAGLGADPVDSDEQAAPVPPPQKVTDSAQHATAMQKTVPAEQVDFYLERGYDRAAGFVHRANEVDHLRTPAELFAALGLVHDGSPFQADAKEAYVLRWPAYRPSLYRIPYGGQSEQALRAMDGWVIERPPFRGNGFAPGEGRDVIAEFKVDSVRLPHGAQLWRMDADGSERMVAIFDADGPSWRRVGEQ
ncbi:MAG TPA: SseB family protein [Actinoplanes sp.]|nr:SseB family protein [Actinoplanes sp.]